MGRGNILIRASAGTGKTYALAMRFIELVKLGGVAPESIVAVTFSRAAAMEIYTKILTRLVEFAGQDPSYIPLIRKTVGTQHRGTIATLDSFIMRIVKAFPLEMGLETGITDVLTEWSERDAFELATERILRRTTDDIGFMDLFRKVVRGKWSVSCRERLEESARKTRDWFLAHHAAAVRLTREDLCRRFGVVEMSGPAPWESAAWPADDPLCAFLAKESRPEANDGHFSETKMGAFAAELACADEGAFVYEYRKRTRTLSAEAAALARSAAIALYSRYMSARIEVVLARIRLLSLVYSEYDRVTKKQGKLTFGDFTRVQASSNMGEGRLKLENIEFRLDAKFDHWEIDEFQDTSEEQWQALRNLVESAADGEGGRTVMVVGDLKQLIYSWRGGTDRPFRELEDSGFFRGEKGEIENKDLSHRYGRQIAEFVNGVFDPEKIDMAEWTHAWRKHEAKEIGDYVKVSPAAKSEDESAQDALVRVLVKELVPVWANHERVESDEEIAILVRSNREGAEYAKALAKAGIPCVWEGKDSIGCEWPERGILRLLRLAEHPDDIASWNLVNVLLPLRERIFPDLASAEAVGAAVATHLLKDGLARTIRDFGAAAEVDVKDLVRLARQYERLACDGYSMENFRKYVGGQSRRAVAVGPRVVHILTIHRSKGLTFDRVFCPLKNGLDFAAGGYKGDDVPKGEDWILPHIPEAVAAFNRNLRRALAGFIRANRLENVRTGYVALTRARKALYLIVPGKEEEGASEYGETPPFAAPDKKNAPPPVAEAAPMRTRHLRRRTPSLEIAHSSRGNADLFAADIGSAAERGKEMHEKFAQIEWGEGVFAKPSADAQVWRERAYEFVCDGVWESGVFDRVVLWTENGVRKAEIIDFKTNRRREGESEEGFIRRMQATYMGQLAGYRRALSALTSISPADILTSLYLTSLSRKVPV